MFIQGTIPGLEVEDKGEAGLGKRQIQESTPEPVTTVSIGGLVPAGAPQRSMANDSGLFLKNRRDPISLGVSAYGLNNPYSPFRFAPDLVSEAQVCCVTPTRQHWNGL